LDEFIQIALAPEIAAGFCGTLVMETFKVVGEEFPHALFAVTVIAPPDIPDVTLIVLVVELPVHPEGSVQV
jgi:hypothetical protein